MALLDFQFLPGIDKQNTTVGAEQRWVDCNNVRFRYLLPEKVGGWSSLITDTIVGVARREFAFVHLHGMQGMHQDSQQEHQQAHLDLKLQIIQLQQG